MKLYITGSKGFIGRHLVRRLKKIGICSLYEAEADITKNHEVKEEIESIKPDKVVHLAAVVSSPWADEADWYTFDVNVKGTYNVAKYSKKIGADFIYASSTSIYKPVRDLITEESEIGPTTIYNLTKWMGEEVVRNLYGDDALILRFCHIYGPDGDHCSIPLKIVRGAIMEYPVVILASPESVRSYLYIDDLIDLIIMSLIGDLRGIYNVSSNEYLKLRQVAETTLKKLREHGIREPTLIWRPEADYMGSHRVDCQKIYNKTGWLPKVKFEEGIDRCIEYINQ